MSACNVLMSAPFRTSELMVAWTCTHSHMLVYNTYWCQHHSGCQNWCWHEHVHVYTCWCTILTDVSTIQNVRTDGAMNMYTFTHVGVQYLLMSAPSRMSELMLANSRLYEYISSRLPARKEWTQPTRPKSTPTRSKILEQYKGRSYLSWQSAVQHIKPMYDGRKCFLFF